MVHLLLFLPPAEGLSEAEKIGESFYVPICKVAPGAKSAYPELSCELLGHTRNPGEVSCPDCKPEVLKFLEDYPAREKFAFGRMYLET